MAGLPPSYSTPKSAKNSEPSSNARTLSPWASVMDVNSSPASKASFPAQKAGPPSRRTSQSNTRQERAWSRLQTLTPRPTSSCTACITARSLLPWPTEKAARASKHPRLRGNWSRAEGWRLDMWITAPLNLQRNIRRTRTGVRWGLQGSALVMEGKLVSYAAGSARAI